MAPAPVTIDDYAAALPERPREILAEVRRVITDIVPGATESIRYQMPVFRFDGMYLLYVGAWKKHLGLSPIPTLPADLEAQITRYRTKVDTVRFLFDQPVPYDLIRQLVEALVPIRRVENR